MTGHFDTRETQAPDARREDLFARLPALLRHAAEHAPGWANHLDGVDLDAVTGTDALARLPLMRKAALMRAQREAPPFGGFAADDGKGAARVFMSPGPIWEPQGAGADPWNAARALFASGFRKGDIVHNAFAYHMTPGGFILDTGATALGCTVFPAGTGNTEMQVEAIAALNPAGYIGTPDFLKVILDKAREMTRDLPSLARAHVGGGALFPALRQEYADRGIATTQSYATADLGVVAYESEAMEGMIVNEDYIVEIVRPGTGAPVAEGEVGEVVVTSFNMVYPMIRLGTGDLSAVLAGQSPCGRTNMRIRGWMGRADQRTKVKGMFVDPVQIAEVARKVPGAGRIRLVVTREGASDAATLKVEHAGDAGIAAKLEEAAQAACKVRVGVDLVPPGSLPNDGKVIADERDYS